jgi:5-methylcytosine-specific restriction endonuclease McrA
MSAETFLNGRVMIACSICDKPFTVERSRLTHGRGKHCSPACQYEALRRRPKIAVACECIGCGAKFDLPPSVVRNRKGAGKYCTRACRDLHWVGRNNPNFQNGDKVYKRGPYWHSIRRRILARDGYKCRACGAGGHLHVHHIIPFRAVADKDSANHPDNLVSLCPPCHRKEDAKYKWVVRPQSGWALMIPAGPIWEMAKERGCV